MARPNYIELPGGERAGILYEDRSALAIDKPAGWLLAPESWQRTSRNLQTALVAALHSGEFWARSRGLKFLRFVHRLDAETSGVLLWAKSPGALRALSALFEGRSVEKRYLAVVQGRPKEAQWICRLKLGLDARRLGRVLVDPRQGKDAETAFRTLEMGELCTLVEARPVTGRTHQIRVHLAESGTPVLGDVLYGGGPARPGPAEPSLALRAVSLKYLDPFTRRRVNILAPIDEFLVKYGFKGFETQKWMAQI